ncbi:MAG: hypothetical protein M1832_002373 [Thelocarpon impressellum]|nr:MAG: hypothetical protein M1832_002373 [Thelocarpon impressellum]
MTAARHSNRTVGVDGDESTLQRKSLSTILEPQDEQNGPQPPQHPVECMQGAFEESMAEMMDPPEPPSSRAQSEKVDSATRRRILLEQATCEDTHAARWRKKPGERYHPIWKIVAQISFGVHLLHVRMAKSEEDVLNILQTHVDEVDGFLERTTEDFDLAIEDINERLRCLKLPLEHGDVFDIMLEDRVFRKQIVDGNEKIEHISTRTTTAMNDALRDVRHGLEATRELAKYMSSLDREWAERTPEQNEVYSAMSGNAEGWYGCFLTLQTKGHCLSSSVIQLGGIIAELQKRAGIASRKNIVRRLPCDTGADPLTLVQAGLVALERSGSRSTMTSPVSRPLSPPARSLLEEPRRAPTPSISETAAFRERQHIREKLPPNKETRFITHSGNESHKPRRQSSMPNPNARTSSLKAVRGKAVGEALPATRQRQSLARKNSEARSWSSPRSRSLPGASRSKKGATPGRGNSRPRFFSRRPSIIKVLSFRRNQSHGQAAKRSAPPPETTKSTTSLLEQSKKSHVSPSHFFALLSSGRNSRAQSPTMGQRIRQPLSPFNESAVPEAPGSPDSSLASIDRVTSPEMTNTTRSTTPGTRSTTPSPPKAEASHDPAGAAIWPPKAATLLGPEGAAASPTIKTGPEKGGKPDKPDKSGKPKKAGSEKGHKYKLSKEMEMALSTKPREKPPTTLDIGPTKKSIKLKFGLEALKKPFEQDNVLLQLLYGGGVGDRGQY